MDAVPVKSPTKLVAVIIPVYLALPVTPPIVTAVPTLISPPG